MKGRTTADNSAQVVQFAFNSWFTVLITVKGIVNEISNSTDHEILIFAW
ncbi:MAG: hypothetical protein PF588_05815 [Candidatus Kapabacteria bacterium]|nr:hypothetical protein [Candidatus Kapabacteria bacterium]